MIEQSGEEPRPDKWFLKAKEGETVVGPAVLTMWSGGTYGLTRDTVAMPINLGDQNGGRIYLPPGNILEIKFPNNSLSGYYVK